MPMFFSNPEEMQEAFEQSQLLQRNTLHEFERSLREMPRETLQAHAHVWHLAGHTGEDHFTTHVEGMIRGIMAMRFDVCLFCNVNHDEEAAKELAAQEEKPDEG